MSKLYYKYDRKKQRYRRISPTRGQRFWFFFNRILSGIGSGVATFLLLSFLLTSPKEMELSQENSKMKSQLMVLSSQNDNNQGMIDVLKQRDVYIYRALLRMDPDTTDLYQLDNIFADKYEQLAEKPSNKLLVSTTKQLDNLQKQIYQQSVSFDSIVVALKNQDKRIACVPAIQPVSNKDLKYTASGYGWRIDPIYGTRKFHEGMDFAAKRGTPINATGDGRVTKAQRVRGYGNCIVINHGFDYETLYAHLNSIDVRRGQKVKRGQKIGEVGSTGKSTGPHLHYEVHYKGRVHNPINYYFMDLNEDQYDKILELAESHRETMD